MYNKSIKLYIFCNLKFNDLRRNNTLNKVIIELKNVSLSYDDDPEHLIVNSINLQIYENEFVTLLGPSGCGKTTDRKSVV